MDRVRGELLPPILIRELHREARRQSLVRVAVSQHDRQNTPLAAWFGAALIRAGCRMQFVGERLTVASTFAAPAPCGRGA